MYVRWQSRRRRTSAYPPWEEGDIHWRAILVENTRVDGKPRQKHIAYLVGFTESRIKIAVQRCHLWDTISARLDDLGNRITAADRERIEAAIAEKVLRPTVAEYKREARRSAQEYGWAWLSERQRAALQDEAERWQNSEGDLAARIRGAASGVTNSSG
jgi:hypothetical protein